MRISVALALAVAGAGVGYTAVMTAHDPGAVIDRLLYGEKNMVGGAAPAPTAATGPAPAQVLPRVFSSSQPLLREPASRAADAIPEPTRGALPITSVTPAVALEPPALSDVTDPTVRRLASSRPADEESRRELVKNLQRELKRVGCFEGEVTGTWGPGSKKAMASFTDRVNATLPLDEPDYILLTLVQGHGDKACGMACPGGQGLDDGGKCVPRAVLAQNIRRGPDRTALTGQALATQTDNQAPPAANPATRILPRPPAPARITNAWSTVVTTPPQQQQAQPRPVVEPLPGRMAIGATAASVTAAAEQPQTEIANRKIALPTARERMAGRPPVISAPVAAATPVTPPGPALRQPVERVEKKPVDAPTTTAAPRVASAPARLPAPRFVPPYAVGRIATTAPKPSYAPQPTRWTRTIFNDLNRMR